jgi:hypothetical protein
MNLDQFIAYKKRTTQYGDPTQLDDQAAKDVLASINDNIDRIAKNWLWDWLLEPFNITLQPTESEYTLPVTVQKIVVLTAGEGTIKNIGLKEFMNFRGSPGVIQAGRPEWYFNFGRDPLTGARIISIGNIPETPTDITGMGKNKFPRFTEADLGTGKTFLPFPVDGEAVLGSFVEADIYRLQGKKDLIFPQQQLAESQLKAWRGEDATEPAYDATSNLPEYIRLKMINRRNGYVV